MFCSTCQQKLIKVDHNINNIWGFNPYSFKTYKSLKEGFREFYIHTIKNTPKVVDDTPKVVDIVDDTHFYSSYNESGYTYTQWYIYIISKNNYKYKELKKITLWLFQVLSGYDFFKKLIALGKRDDPLHNTIHHFLKYLDNMGIYQEIILNLLTQNDLSLDKEDGEGLTGNDYLITKILSDEDLRITREITKQYKIEEELIFKHELFKDNSFSKCNMCYKFIDIYQDMLKNKSKIIIFDSIINKLKTVIQKRQDCIDIYKKYEKCNNSTNRHIYVVKIYKNII